MKTILTAELEGCEGVGISAYMSYGDSSHIVPYNNASSVGALF